MHVRKIHNIKLKPPLTHCFFQIAIDEMFQLFSLLFVVKFYHEQLHHISYLS